MKTLREKEEEFHKLHHSGDILMLPNIWDPIGAMLLQKAGYPAVATSSSAVALSKGYPDGEQLPFDEQLKVLQEIVCKVNVPVTADVESAYAGDNINLLKENIRKLINTGIAGLNFEDSYHGKPGMVSIAEQTQKLKAIRQVADEEGSRLFINARIDVYIKRDDLNSDEKLKEAITRGVAYKESGADGLYPIILQDAVHIRELINEVGLLLNLTLLPGLPDFESMKKMGVARISLASGYFRAAITEMKRIAEELLTAPANNYAPEEMVSSDFMNGLLNG